MAVKKKETNRLNDTVEFMAFKDSGKYKDDIFVAVNGKKFKIQRGVKVRIPRYVYNVIKRSQDQDTYTAKLIEAEETNFKRKSKSYI